MPAVRRTSQKGWTYDRDKVVESYIPELAERGFAGATIGQLFDMTAGTSWNEAPEELVNPESPARVLGAATGSWVIASVRSTGVAEFLPTIEKDRPHGKNFMYNTPQVGVIWWVLANVTKRFLDQSAYSGVSGQLISSRIPRMPPPTTQADDKGWIGGGVCGNCWNFIEAVLRQFFDGYN